MRKLELEQSLKILGNLGVIIGILLLVYELNQNRQMMEAQTRHDLSESIVNQFLDIASDGELAEIIIRGASGTLESEVEQTRFRWWLLSRFRYWEDVHYQYRVGLYDQTEFDAQWEGFKVVLMRDPWVNYFQGNVASFSPEFAAKVHETIAELQGSE